MNRDFEQYRFARIEGHNITQARLETQFRNRITDVDEIESAIAKELTAEPANCTPWRTTEMEQTGCREGIRMAALEFYWSLRQELRRASRNNPGEDKPDRISLES
jgi:hypothetical protein